MSETVVIGLNWVGDNILALPTYKALQHRFSNEGGITLAAPQNVAALFQSSGIFRGMLPWSSSTAGRIRALRDGRFRRAVILPNSFRAAMVTFAARIPERWGYAADYRGMMLTNAVERVLPRTHQLDDYSALLDAIAAPRVIDELPTITLPVALREKARKRLRNLNIRLDRPLFGIHAGGLYGRAKHWGDGRFGEVAERLRNEGFDVVLLTSPGERAQAQSIAAMTSGAPIVGHDGDVLELAAAISLCSLVVTNDSGPLHLSAALAVPSVSIFGPTDPDRTVIPGASRVVRRTYACQPCYRRECPLGDHRCMRDIAVDEVYEAAIGLYQEVEGRIVAGRRAKQRFLVRP
jgi:heptosyltransferase-2